MPLQPRVQHSKIDILLGWVRRGAVEGQLKQRLEGGATIHERIDTKADFDWANHDYSLSLLFLLAWQLISEQHE